LVYSVQPATTQERKKMKVLFVVVVLFGLVLAQGEKSAYNRQNAGLDDLINEYLETTPVQESGITRAGYGTSSVVIGNVAYFFGGSAAGHDSYDFITDTWSTDVSLPGVQLNHPAVTVIDDRIVVAGGYNIVGTLLLLVNIYSLLLLLFQMIQKAI
jgi:hypothetical protein